MGIAINQHIGLLVGLVFMGLMGGMSIIFLIQARKNSRASQTSLDIARGSWIGEREFQEDATEIITIKNKGTLAAIADGMGKNRAGSLSSTLAVQTFAELFMDEYAIQNINYFFKRTFHTINRDILNQLGDLQGGASVVCAIVINQTLHYAVVGNTIIAVFRNKELIPLSKGHTVSVLAEKGYYEGKISRQHALWALREKRLLNYVGRDEFEDIEIYDMPVKLQRGDKILLMSDGVHETLGWHALETILNKDFSAQDLANNVMEELKKSSTSHKDNASIVVINYNEN